MMGIQIQSTRSFGAFLSSKLEILMCVLARFDEPYAIETMICDTTDLVSASYSSESLGT